MLGRLTPLQGRGMRDVSWIKCYVVAASLIVKNALQVREGRRRTWCV